MTLASKRKDIYWSNRGQFTGNRTQKYVDEKGYVRILVKRGKRRRLNFSYEHRIVMERYLNRKLLSTEVIHHINEIKTDNRVENLYLTNVGEHAQIHATGGRKAPARRPKLKAS